MRVRLGLVALADSAVVFSTRPDGDQLRRTLRRLSDEPDPALVELARCALFATAVWAALALGLLLLATVPGRVGSAGRRGARRLLPAAARRAVAGTLGLGLVLTPVVASARTVGPPATAAGSTSAPAPVWPIAPIAPRTPITPRTAAPPAPVWPTTPSPAPHRQASDPVVVRPGDSLWTLARARLGRAPSDARVAAAWPAWWVANRPVIGADPDLIRPGQVLHAPAPGATHRTDRIHHTPGGTS